jgi:hypothetical protein
MKRRSEGRVASQKGAAIRLLPTRYLSLHVTHRPVEGESLLHHFRIRLDAGGNMLMRSHYPTVRIKTGLTLTCSRPSSRAHYLQNGPRIRDSLLGRFQNGNFARPFAVIDSALLVGTESKRPKNGSGSERSSL